MTVHHAIRLATSPYTADAPDLEVAGFVPCTPADADTARTYAGRAALIFEAGAFSLRVRPTAADLRRLASVCTMLADELDQRRDATTEVMRLVGAA